MHRLANWCICKTLASNKAANVSFHRVKRARERGGTDLCEERSFSEEVGSALSAPVRNPETWLEEVRLSFWIKKKRQTNKNQEYQNCCC